LLPAGTLAALPKQFQPGIARHRAIDRFTDSHPAVTRSIERLDPGFRRYGGIIIDVLYDHFLARDWNLYSPESLSNFTKDFYASFDEFRNLIPADAFVVLEKMRAGDWLGSYAEIAGISQALRRIGARLLRPIDLAESLSVPDSSYDSLSKDFHEFFPELRSMCSAKH